MIITADLNGQDNSWQRMWNLIIWSALFMYGPYAGGKYLLKCHVIASYFLNLLQNSAQALGLQLKV